MLRYSQIFTKNKNYDKSVEGICFMSKGIQLIYKDYLYPDDIEKWSKWLDVSGILFNEESYDGTFFAIPSFGINEYTTKQDVDIILGDIIYRNHGTNNEDSEDFGFVLTEKPETTLENLLDYINRHLDYMIDPHGGLMFFDGDKKIFSGCCAALVNGLEALTDIYNKQDAFMGHDPWVYAEYKKNSVIIWGDNCLDKYENPKDNIVNIEFSNDELHIYLSQAKKDVERFLLNPFKQRLTELHADIADELTCAIMKWIGCETIQIR